MYVWIIVLLPARIKVSSACIVLTEKTEKWWTESLKSSAQGVIPHKHVSLSSISSKSHIVLEVDPTHIHTITTQSIKITTPDKIAENYSKRQIPRFKWVTQVHYVSNIPNQWSALHSPNIRILVGNQPHGHNISVRLKKLTYCLPVDFELCQLQGLVIVSTPSTWSQESWELT